jgi:hypothetical protein
MIPKILHRHYSRLIQSKEQGGEVPHRKEEEENGTDFGRLFWDFGIPAQTVARFYYVELIFSQQKI